MPWLRGHLRGVLTPEREKPDPERQASEDARKGRRQKLHDLDAS